MKKKLNITIDDEDWKFLEERYINKSALIRGLIKKFIQNSV